MLFMTFKSDIMEQFKNEFKIIFKCMTGATTDNGKFIMPLEEKLSYDDSFDRCESEGFSLILWFDKS